MKCNVMQINSTYWLIYANKNCILLQVLDLFTCFDYGAGTARGLIRGQLLDVLSAVCNICNARISISKHLDAQRNSINILYSKYSIWRWKAKWIRQWNEYEHEFALRKTIRRRKKAIYALQTFLLLQHHFWFKTITLEFGHKKIQKEKQKERYLVKKLSKRWIHCRSEEI